MLLNDLSSHGSLESVVKPFVVFTNTKGVPDLSCCGSCGTCLDTARFSMKINWLCVIMDFA